MANYTRPHMLSEIEKEAVLRRSQIQKPQAKTAFSIIVRFSRDGVESDLFIVQQQQPIRWMGSRGRYPTVESALAAIKMIDVAADVRVVNELGEPLERFNLASLSTI